MPIRSCATSSLFALLATAACQEPRAVPEAFVAPAAAAAATAAPAPDDRRIAWQRRLADAEALAARTGRPILLALNMDGESASDRMPHENYRDPRFVALTRRVVCVGASVFRHNERDHDEHGRRIECPRFTGLTCGEHVALEPELFARFFPDGERVAPRHALVLPDGSKAFDLSLSFDLTDVDRALAAATADLGPWTLPAATDWAELAARRDANGRSELERAVDAAADPATLQEALAAIAAHGDAGAIDALQLAAARPWSDSIRTALAVAQELGCGDTLAAFLRARAQRLGAAVTDLRAPLDLEPLVRALAAGDRSPTTRTFLFGLLAGGPTAPTLRTELAQALGVQEAPPVAIDQLITLHQRTTSTTPGLPVLGATRRELRPAAELQRELAELDRRIHTERDSAELWAQLGIASLDLARVQIETGGSQAELLLEDARRQLREATARAPERYEWWLEAARVAFLLARFDEQVEHGVRALAVTGHPWPLVVEQLPALLDDARAVEALNWIGDGRARQFANDDFADPAATLTRQREALLALGAAAAAPFGDANDQIGFASFVESLGLVREELAILRAAQLRLPTAPELRQAVYGACWRAGQPELAVALADEVAHAAPSLDTTWWAGHARMLLAEDLRRQLRFDAATFVYRNAQQRFAAVVDTASRTDGAANYLASASTWHALALLGEVQCHAAEPARSAARVPLVRLMQLDAAVAGLRDGLGQDALDAVDKLLEWRAAGESDVTASQLLDDLPADAPQRGFWSTAIADAALREALRADGRNPAKRDAETVDAKGQPMRAMVGLPTELGDVYLRQAITAGARAIEAPDGGDAARTVFAQAQTIFAERELLRGRTDGVAEALRAAAATLGLERLVVLADDADAATLAAAASDLRARLGPARPRLREGR